MGLIGCQGGGVSELATNDDIDLGAERIRLPIFSDLEL